MVDQRPAPSEKTLPNLKRRLGSFALLSGDEPALEPGLHRAHVDAVGETLDSALGREYRLRALHDRRRVRPQPQGRTQMRRDPLPESSLALIEQMALTEARS